MSMPERVKEIMDKYSLTHAQAYKVRHHSPDYIRMYANKHAHRSFGNGDDPVQDGEAVCLHKVKGTGKKEDWEG